MVQTHKFWQDLPGFDPAMKAGALTSRLTPFFVSYLHLCIELIHVQQYYLVVHYSVLVFYMCNKIAVSCIFIKNIIFLFDIYSANYAICLNFFLYFISRL